MSEQKTTVDVPEAAVVAAANAALDAGFVDPDDGTIPQWYGEDPIPVWTHPSEAVKVIIAAALPHLAPVGDGGLREAQLRQEFRAEIMRGYQAALCNSDVPGWTLGDEVGKVADKLLAIPAAPAVPQPVDREALERIRAYLAVAPNWDELAQAWDQEAGVPRKILASDLRTVLAVFAGEQARG